MMNAEVFIQILLASWILPAVIVSNNSLSVQTQQGIYTGRQTVRNGIRVNYWYGIPYAQQPVAYMYNACPQKNTQGIPSTEACLTLNVYAPENAANLSVHIWIHGGSFTTGAGIMYDATDFISTGASHSLPVVFITINYRLGFLGFLADQGLYDEKSGINNRRTTGNYGLLDHPRKKISMKTANNVGLI